MAVPYHEVKPRDCPYFGLDYYSEEWGDWFFGREPERNRIITNLRAARLTLVHAESGAGKSSLLRAGVAWRLRQLTAQKLSRRGAVRYLPIVFSSWKDDPVPQLVGDIRTAIESFLDGHPVPELPKDKLDQAIVTAAGAADAKLLLILDQFEEYFIYSTRESTPEYFADELARCINTPDLPANFLIAIREDAYSGLGDLFKGRIANVYGNYLHIEYLDHKDARDAICKPLSVFNEHSGVEAVEIEPALVDAVLAQVPAHLGDGISDMNDASGKSKGDVAGDAGGTGGGNGLALADGQNSDKRIATALLQLVMESIWNEERSAGSNVLRLSTLEKLEGVERIVDTHLTKALGKLNDEERQTAIDCFDHLVTPSGGKIAESVPDLASRTSRSEATVSNVLDKLDESRIVRPVPAPPGRDPMRFRRFEIFHDVLAPAINRVIETAKSDEHLRKARRLVTLAVGLLVLVVAIAVVFVFLWNNANNDNANAQSDRVASEADALIGSDGELSTLLALQAVRIRPTAAAITALAEAIPAVQEVRTIGVGSTSGTQPYDASFRPDGREIVVAGSDGNAYIYSTADGSLLRTIPSGNDELNTAVFSPNGSEILTANYDGRPRIFNAQTGASEPLSFSPVNGDECQSAVFGPDGQEIAASFESSTRSYIDIWSSPTQPPRQISLTTNPAGFAIASYVAFSPNGTEVAATDGESTIRVFNVTSGQLVATLTRRDESRAQSVAFSPNGQYIAAAYKDGQVIIWNFASGTIRTLDTIGLTYSASFSPDGSELITGNDLGQATVWNWQTGTKVTDLNIHQGSVYTTAFSPNGKEVLTANENGTVKLWDAAPRAQNLLETHSTGVSPVSVALYEPGTDSVVAGDLNGLITVWPDTSSNEAHTLQGDPSGISGLTVLTPDLVEVNQNGSDQEWDLQTFKGINPNLNSSYGSVGIDVLASNGAEFIGSYAPDNNGKYENSLYSPSGNHYEMYTSNEVTAADFNQSGSKVLILNGSSLNVYNLQGKQVTRPIEITSGATVTDAALSPDAARIVTSDDLGNATVFNASNGSVIATLSAGTGQLNTAVFDPADPTDNTILTAGDDGTLRIWDVSSDGELEVMSAPGSGAMTTATFNASGTQVLSGSNDGTVRIWSAIVSLPKLEREADQTVTRQLTPQERAEYLAG